MKAYFAKKIITPDQTLNEAFLIEDQGKIIGLEKTLDGDIPVTLYENCILAPGFIDIHTHGALNYEPGFGPKTELLKWSEYLLKHGVTGFLPSTAAVPLKKIKEAAADVKDVMSHSDANILGLHLEGPFFGPGPKIGAQNPEHLMSEFTREYQEFISEYRGTIKYLAVDPALTSAREIVTFCVGLGIRVAAAHSSILYEDFLKRKSWGFSAVTHTFNGMVGLDHRQPGLAYASCMDRDLYGEIICDGFHVCYPMIELFFRLKGYEKAILITDSMHATGLTAGNYTIGGVKVTVTDTGKVFKFDGGLAGSTLTMDQAVRNLVNILDIPLSQVIFMASTAPAAMLGIGETKGSIALYKDADFILLDPDLNVIATYIKGRNMFQAGG